MTDREKNKKWDLCRQVPLTPNAQDMPGSGKDIKSGNALGKSLFSS